MSLFTKIKCSLLLGDGEGGDLSRMGIVLAIERCVHGEFAPEDQLTLPSVSCSHTHTKHAHQIAFMLANAQRARKMLPTCFELVVGPRLGCRRMDRLREGRLGWVSRQRQGAFGLALGVVDKHEAVLLVDAESV